jgi:hypothetical protein
VSVRDHEGTEIESQLIPISNASLHLRNTYVKAYTGNSPSTEPKFWLAFSVTVPPLGFSTYMITSTVEKGLTEFMLETLKTVSFCCHHSVYWSRIQILLLEWY